ncbi:hypothetical protein AYL99_01777 [Fonsecaea erecta]|uniref:O-acetylhomoserine (Thiol)-lyase n=1 Tax=Fonsecaea erecta TaxID=1367422 RepID=A0A178ZRW3_9EURO|nr:hypothetical protein AYL99_01777 [Fonsecaea erecta]OAP62550.1 hypothetical protein AYL99_01777 [Fonsecaea erecta]
MAPLLNVDDEQPVQYQSHLLGHISKGASKPKEAPGWRFDTRQVHSGLEEKPAYGQCTLPIYNTVSFKFTSDDSAIFGFGDIAKRETFIYSRLANPTNNGFEKRMTALEGGVEGLAFSSGGAAVLGVVMSLAAVGDNVIISGAIHSGTHHQFHKVLSQLGIEARVCNVTEDIERIRRLIDDNTKFIFTESLGNPSLAVPDFEPLAAIAHDYQIPLVVDATLTAGGYFCQPAEWGADIIIHSATKWIGGHGTTLGGIVIGTACSDWQANKARFPRLHGQFPGLDAEQANWYKSVGDKAYMQFLKKDYMRDYGPCLTPLAAQQLLIGVETLSVRCQRQSENAYAIARWLRAHPRVASVQYLGFDDHPSHQRALKYFQRGFGTIVNFELKGGAAEAIKFIDCLKLITNTTNVGDAKTLIGHHRSTTHREFTTEDNAVMGVSESLCRLSLGIEDIEDLIEDFEQAFQCVSIENFAK